MPERSVCIKDMALYKCMYISSIHYLVLSCATVSLLCYCTHCVMSVMNKSCVYLFMFIISPHGIAMPKGLYFTAVVFPFFLLCFSSLFFFFSTPNLWGHWTDLNQTCTHIHLWLLFEKFGPNSPGIYLPRTGAKTAFWDRRWTWPKEPDINNRKETCQSTKMPYMSPKFGELWSRNGWQRLASFAHPLNFRIGRHCQPYHMNVI